MTTFFQKRPLFSNRSKWVEPAPSASFLFRLGSCGVFFVPAAFMCVWGVPQWLTSPACLGHGACPSRHFSSWTAPRDGPAHWQQLQQFGIDYFKIICVSNPTFDWFLDIRNVLCFILPVPKSAQAAAVTHCSHIPAGGPTAAISWSWWPNHAVNNPN